MIREPLKGIECVIPVSPDTIHSLASPDNTVRGIIACVQASDDDWEPLTALNLPALPTTVGDMAEGLKRIAGDKAHRPPSWKIDPLIEKIVNAWPTRIGSPRAQALGMKPNASFDDIVREHIAQNHPELV
jgi:nucleoside-diphosphate-sugar epimerase